MRGLRLGGCWFNGLAAVDALAPEGGPIPGHHPVEGYVLEFGVGQVRIAVGEGGLHGEADGVDVVGRVVAHGGEVVALQDVEDCDEGCAAVGRGGAGDGVATVTAGEGSVFAQAVLFKVLPGDETAVGGQVGGHALHELAVVEVFAAVLDYVAQ